MLNASPQVRAAQLERAFLDACELDMEALKPGNVGLHGGGHGMDCAAFRDSAKAAAAPLAAADGRVGRRILRAIEATRHAVACNTNLGIVLLVAPLMHAAHDAAIGGELRAALGHSLAGLDVDDARMAYAAIRCAQPGGLGETKQNDVRDEPQITLLAAMAQAEERDSIAAQYANAYADVFELGLPLLRAAQARWGSAPWAAALVFLEFAAQLPDSHISRKHGPAAARRHAQEARKWALRLRAADDPADLAADLLHWDRSLKAAGLNPGTSADLTVATVLAGRIQDMLAAESNMHHEFIAAGSDAGRRDSATGTVQSAAPNHPTKQRGETLWRKSLESA